MDTTKIKAIIAKTQLGYTGRVSVYEQGRRLWTASTHVYRLSRLDTLHDIQSIIGREITL